MTHADLQGFKPGMEFYPEIRPVVLPVPVKSGLFGGTSKLVVPKAPEFEVYDFYVAVLVKASLKRTREVLTHYKVYADLVPYISRVEYFRASKTLHVEGGIWRYRINSRVRFDERGDGWIRFRIASGHFRGMEGEILLEPVGDQGAEGTLVFMRGQSIANRFPPAFVIEQGAQVVFGLTANRIRSYIESGRIPPPLEDLPSQPVNPAQEQTPSPVPGEKISGAPSHDPELPQPRRRFK
jgi:hypothetical protein